MTNQSLESSIVIRPATGRVHVIFDDAEIASSVRALEVEEPGQPKRLFLPFDDVQPGILEASDTRKTSSGLGEAHYYTIKTLTADGPDQAWYYPDPSPSAEELRDYLAFSGDRLEYRQSPV